MKTITKTINLYRFDELSEDAQEKVRYDIQQLDCKTFFEEDMQYHVECLEESQELFQSLKLEGYSLSYCQGDGVSITAESFKIPDQETADKVQSTLCEEFPDDDWKVEVGHMVDIEWCKVNHSHMHENTYVIYGFYYAGYAFTCDDLKDSIQSAMRDICKEAERMGYDQIDDYGSHEHVSKTCEINDYWFTEDGEINND